MRKGALRTNLGRLLAVLIGTSFFIGVAHAGLWWWNGAGERTVGSFDFVRIPATGTLFGIGHDYDPDDYQKYRVLIYHDDADYPNVPFISDDFDPVAGPKPLCVPHSSSPSVWYGERELPQPNLRFRQPLMIQDGDRFVQSGAGCDGY